MRLLSLRPIHGDWGPPGRSPRYPVREGRPRGGENGFGEGTPMAVGFPHGRSDYESAPEARFTTWGTVSSGFCGIELRGDRLEICGACCPICCPRKPMIWGYAYPW